MGQVRLQGKALHEEMGNVVPPVMVPPVPRLARARRGTGKRAYRQHSTSARMVVPRLDLLTSAAGISNAPMPTAKPVRKVTMRKR